MKFSIPRGAFLAGICISIWSLSSCEKSTQQTPASDSTAVAVQDSVQAPARLKEPEYELTFPKGSKYQNLTPPAGVTPNPFQEIARISASHKGNSNWADKHADIKGVLLQNARKDYLFVLQQQAANEMLRRELFAHYYQDPGHQDMLRAIGFYTEQLVEAKSEDSELIYKCLRALNGFWDNSKIARVAAVTAARVQARPVLAAADTTSRNGSYRQIYARELKKMANRLSGKE